MGPITQKMMFFSTKVVENMQKKVLRIEMFVNRSTTVRKVPVFPIKMWSVYQRLLDGLPRTNNSLESWHKQFLLFYLTC